MSENIVLEIIKIIPNTLWPLIVLIAIILYGGELKMLLKNVKRGSLFGNEFEIKDEVKKLEAKIIREQGKKIIEARPRQLEIEFDENRRPIERLLSISGQIEKELKKIVYSSGWYSNISKLTVNNIANFLVSNSVLPANVKSSLDAFQGIMNRVIHGEDNINEEDMLRVIDIGRSILIQIDGVPLQKNIVAYINVELFTDEKCKKAYNKGKGIILKTISPGKETVAYRIFPTTKDYQEIDFEITWEWSFENKWNEAYYKDPVDKKIKLGWNSSAEFVGRNIEEIF